MNEWGFSLSHEVLNRDDEETAFVQCGSAEPLGSSFCYPGNCFFKVSEPPPFLTSLARAGEARPT